MLLQGVAYLANGITFGYGVGYIAKKVAYGLLKAYIHFTHQEIEKSTRNDLLKTVKVAFVILGSITALIYNERQIRRKNAAFIQIEMEKSHLILEKAELLAQIGNLKKENSQTKKD